ncbi:MAG: NUDIX hydrolase [Candidatus Marinimicrobia bacterium]|nr:NUDIX hydrolase [Candidatus Neomarinimicrobiota bacterium]
MKSSTSFEEIKIDSQRVFDGRLLQVYNDMVRLSNGNIANREWIKHPGAAVVIPYLGNGQILMVRQFRYPVRQTMLELPAGKIDPGEQSVATIRRELAEETGYTPEKLTEISRIHTCVGYSSECLFLYWANGLRRCDAHPDEDELIETVALDIEEAMSRLYRGEITDAKTIIGLFWADNIINRGQLNLVSDKR